MKTDGAAKGKPGQASGGGIIGDHRGAMLSAFMEYHGHGTSAKEELLALRDGLRLAHELQVQGLEIVVDVQTCRGLVE